MSGEQKKPANGDSVNVALMKAMGSKSGASDPIPPTQHEALMHKRETEEIRILGALFGRTIARGQDGTRSAAAREPLTGRFTREGFSRLSGPRAGQLVGSPFAPRGAGKDSR